MIYFQRKHKWAKIVDRRKVFRAWIFFQNYILCEKILYVIICCLRKIFHLLRGHLQMMLIKELDFLSTHLQNIQYSSSLLFVIIFAWECLKSCKLECPTKSDMGGDWVDFSPFQIARGQGRSHDFWRECSNFYF